MKEPMLNQYAVKEGWVSFGLRPNETHPLTIPQNLN